MRLVTLNRQAIQRSHFIKFNEFLKIKIILSLFLIYAYANQILYILKYISILLKILYFINLSFP